MLLYEEAGYETTELPVKTSLKKVVVYAAVTRYFDFLEEFICAEA